MGTVELKRGDAAVVLREGKHAEMHYTEQEDGELLLDSTEMASLLMICMQAPHIMKEARRIFNEMVK